MVVVGAPVVVVVPAPVVVVPATVVVVVGNVTPVVVVLLDPAWTIALTVTCEGGCGVTPAGRKAIVRRMYWLKWMADGLVVIVGLAWPKADQ